jgi:hypothetical protein
MQTLPLTLDHGHLCLMLGGRRWLLDTGSPASFGDCASVNLGSREHRIHPSYMGQTAGSISQLSGLEVGGLLGGDILGEYDLLMDLESETCAISTDQIPLTGEVLTVEEIMGVPSVEVVFGGQRRSVFFDTCASVGYLQCEGLEDFPYVGSFDDFYPGFGSFSSDTHAAKIGVGTRQVTLRTGQLPTILGMAISLVGVEGILGNEMLALGPVGYFPRRNMLVVA